MPNEPELQGLTEADFFSLPWKWIFLVVLLVAVGIFVRWAWRYIRKESGRW